MKKTMIIAFTVLFVNVIWSQDNISYGLKAGLNIAYLNDLETGDWYEYKSRLAYHIGGFAEIGFSEQFSVQPELLFSSLGFKYNESVLSSSLEENTRLEYLTFPVLVKYYPLNNLSIELGPQLGILLYGKYESKSSFTDDGITLYDSRSINITDGLKSLDFSIGVGVGYKLDNGLLFNTRYILGLTNIYDETKDKNRAFQLSVGYVFM